MAKKQTRSEITLLYCSGPNWEGDGSRATSKCPKHHSGEYPCVKYRCPVCSDAYNPIHRYRQAITE